MDAVNRQIEGGGVPEACWRDCAWLNALPLRSPASLLGQVKRLVVVSPHPDDEVLACGGLMASAQAAGTPVLVVSVTDGESCYPGQPQWPPVRLRAVRRQELDGALQCLGLGDAERLAWQIADGAVSASEADIAGRLGTLLRRGDLMLLPWRFDGHPDHEAVARAGLRAAQANAVAVREYPVWGWHWLDPQMAPVAWASAVRYALSTENSERKRQALRQFITQTGDVPGLDCEPILPRTVLERFERHYEVLIG